MDNATRALEVAVWAAAEGVATDEQRAMLEADPRAWCRMLERLIDDTEDRLDVAHEIVSPERRQVVADFERDLDRLEAAYDLLTGKQTSAATAATAAVDPVGEVRLQASWHSGDVIVWAAGPDTLPAPLDELRAMVDDLGGGTVDWRPHRGVPLPMGVNAAALSLPLSEALGWLVAIGGGLDVGKMGASLIWLGHVAVAAVRLAARGAIVPTLQVRRRQGSKHVDASVKWVPVLVDDALVDRMAAALPPAVTALARGEARSVTIDLIGSAVQLIATGAAARMEMPAPPPLVRTNAEVSEAVITRLDGSAFEAPQAAAGEIAKRLERWSEPVRRRRSGTRLVVQLDPPDTGDAWFLSVLGPGAEGGLLPIEVALGDSKYTKPLADEIARLERSYPVLLRPGGFRRGQVYLSQDEAWELMTVTGPSLEAAGFDVRVPALSRRKVAPSLRLFAQPSGDTAVGAHQLSDVRWSAVFDDVELTAAEISRLAAEARPLVKSRGRWIELDKADLKEAAAALAERSQTTQLSGAEILRHAVGLEGSPLAGGLVVEGGGWARDLLDRARSVQAKPDAQPAGFHGELRSYQAEALGWLDFLDATELGGCLALDMGLGKTPTILAHLARSPRNEPTLVIAPPAVVGNWAAEAARFTPGLRVVIHHGASRAAADQIEAEAAGADVIITTYGTAVRDVDALSERTWGRVVLDEAQAIKNPASETAQLLRRIPARTRLALTGTPIENGLGDLWSVLDFTNPGLVGDRSTFITQLSGEGEAALRALNGILVFRRTKSEPEVAAELPDRIDELDHCTMTPEQIGLYQAVLDSLVANAAEAGSERKQGAILAAITALKQICNHPAAYQDDGRPLAGRSGKLARLEEIVDSVFAASERILIFTHFAEWGKKLADHLTEVTGIHISCYHGGLARGTRDELVREFQKGDGPGALVLSLKAGGTGLNLTAASHVVLYDRWWNPAVEDQARDRAWRIGQTRTVVSHRLVCPGTVDERVEEVVAGKRHIAEMVLPKSSTLASLDPEQLRTALGLRPELLLTEEEG